MDLNAQLLGNNEDLLNATYTVLVEMGGAGPSMRDNFIANWPECEEYRFRGMWGMSGKIWWNDGKPYVSGERYEKELESINRVITDLWKCASVIRSLEIK